ncbi:caspase family protein [Dolichospermum sp. UHCC 0352]|uniref:caspase, EACC1-associated type n=1 Tax=Dolichospermum sp. UHCC 0352 TaxID=2590011 RepID=UPI001447D22E|nr:caspase family protein [Dolichospermum sp. UHCC 0352]
MAKIALLIGVSEYEPGLTPLPAATKDVEAMQRVLQNPDIGGFDEVKVLVNPPRQEMEEAIEMLFDDRQKDDLLLLFFSGHGIKDEEGNLYFATHNTRKNLLQSTTVSAKVVHQVMKNSRSKREVVILDCCFSGAFGKELSAKGDGFVDIKNQLGGEGRAVLTSSSSTQYSFELQGADTSTYTRYIVEGLKTGAADRDEDGSISVDELHEYAKSKVQEATPGMKPEIYAVKEGYKIQLAKAPIDDPKLKYRREVEYCVRDGEIDNLGRITLDNQKKRLGLTPDEAATIEADVLKPYQDYKENLQEYQKAFLQTIKGKFRVSDKTRAKLKRLQQVLGLRDEDTAKIEDSHKRKLNLGNQFIEILSLGIISFAVAWYIKPDKECLPCKLPPIKITNQFAQVHNVPKGKFNYGGSTSWSFIYPTLESEIKKTHPQFDINIKKEFVKGSGIGIEKLIDGELDFALLSRDVSSLEKDKAGKKYFSLKAIPVVKSGVAVAVNPKLEITLLNLLAKYLLSNYNFSINDATGKIQFSKSGDRINNSIFLIKVQQKPGTNKYEFVPIP